jgi:hypothetical protein
MDHHRRALIPPSDEPTSVERFSWRLALLGAAVGAVIAGLGHWLWGAPLVWLAVPVGLVLGFASKLEPPVLWQR